MVSEMEKELAEAVREYLREHDNPAPDYRLRHDRREQMRAALKAYEAQYEEEQ